MNIVNELGISSSISFSGYTDFASVGLFGLPVIPIYVRLSDHDKIELRVYLKMTKNINFSIQSHPCLILDDFQSVCSTNLEISSMAQYQDDGENYDDNRPRWNQIEGFRKLENLTISFDDEVYSDHINNADIYKFYEYDGIPVFGYFTTSFIFTFKCENKCPGSFKLNADDFLVIEGKTIKLGFLEYKLERYYEYRFSRFIQ